MHLKLIFLYGVRQQSISSFVFYMKSSYFQFYLLNNHTFLQGPDTSSLPFLKIPLFWGSFFSLLSAKMCIPAPISHSLHYYNFRTSLHIQKRSHSFFFSFRNILAILDSLLFYLNFRLNLLSSTIHEGDFYRRVDVSGQ